MINGYEDWKVIEREDALGNKREGSIYTYYCALVVVLCLSD